jgi:hypothetical protein
MTTPIKHINDVATETITIIELTASEIADLETAEVEAAARAHEAEAEAAAVAEAKANAQAKLAALGLTSDDLKALGLGNN